MSQQHIVCYVPVIHTGYLEFFASNPDAVIHVLGNDVLRKRFDYLRKDIRALAPDAAASIVRGMGREADIVGEADLAAMLKNEQLIMPDDDISQSLIQEFGLKDVRLDPVFLRWDRKATETNQEVQPDRTVNVPAENTIVAALYAEASKSTNWWRNVAAALVDDGKVVALTHNSSVPTEYSSMIDGDPRITAHRGINIDTSLDIHAEAQLIGGAAKRGEKLNGASLYVSTFPCPTCAKLIAASGIKQCYFVEGYATVDGQSILKANGVEIIKVDTDAQPFTLSQRAKKYPEK